MLLLLRLLQALGLNAVPVAGVGIAGWTPATALALYWAETLVGSLFLALRIAVHRGRTSKRGHYREQLGLKFESGEGPKAKPIHFKTFLAEFLAGSMAFSVAHGILLWLVLGTALKGEVDFHALRTGLLGMAGFQLFGFLIDLPGLGDWPFANLKARAKDWFGRIMLIHLSLIGGMVLLTWRGESNAFLAVFMALKTIADISALLPRFQPNPERAPGWISGAANKLKPSGDFDAYWREQQESERKRAAEDEQPWNPRGKKGRR